MATYRCRSCGSVYIDPQADGMAYFHACPLDRVGPDKKRHPIPDRRDENIVQDQLTGERSIRAVGLGRELIAEEDLLSGADPDSIAALFARPAIGESPLPERTFEKPKGWPHPGPS